MAFPSSSSSNPVTSTSLLSVSALNDRNSVPDSVSVGPSSSALRTRYQRTGNRLGEGTFGEVVEALDTETGELVALKRIYLKDTETEYFPVAAYRELHAHRVLATEPFIIPFRNYYIESGGTLVVVMERMVCDLGTLLEHRLHILPESVIRRWIYTVLKGIESMHTIGLMHRDLKPQNILLDQYGVCKIGDLGLTRPFKRVDNDATASSSSISSSVSLIPDPTVEYTNQISSRWYRAPEILYGSKAYGPAIDLWGIGCIMVELYTGKPFLPGTSDIEQLARMFKVRGTPTPLTWFDIETLPDYAKIQFSKNDPVPFVTIVPRACNEALDLMERLLTLDPSRRITVTEALRHPYFSAVRSDIVSTDETISIIKEVMQSLQTSTTKPVENHRIGKVLVHPSSSTSSFIPSSDRPTVSSIHHQRFLPPTWHDDDDEKNPIDNEL